LLILDIEGLIVECKTVGLDRLLLKVQHGWSLHIINYCYCYNYKHTGVQLSKGLESCPLDESLLMARCSPGIMFL